MLKSHVKNNNYSGMSLQRCGFTLLEVLVALVIVAFALTALVKGAGGKINNANELRDKTFAQWVAVNKINEWRAQSVFPAISRTTGQKMMGQQEWYWASKVIKTEDKNIRRVELSVYKDEEARNRKLQPVIRLTSFLSKGI
ncbi:hypothetical protein MNBD_GAMMA23-126 [hydrothermal vent metagenome]|uniref:Type II secretion system protein GspI C-terminal domain-containing protein n=1 Tax=hydrothermal vent metagenome TaxID=652676 RepID=A0A3B1AGM4_9ZZZZ